MRVKILFWGPLKNKIGKEKELILPEDAKLLDAQHLLHEVLPEKVHLLWAINENYASPQEKLKDGDTIAVLPPLSGGSDRRLDLHFSENTLDVNSILPLHRQGSTGAIVSFTGTIRKKEKEKEIDGIEYEIYTAMAKKELTKLARKILQKWPQILYLKIHHRIGKVKVGDAAVHIQVEVPHREEGFEACRFAIERLKEKVPIWKIFEL